MRRAALLAAALLSACASRGGGLQPFTTDGCSLFPDRAPIGKSDWCACCIAHDLAYWRGGTEDERKQADAQFEACVHAATGDAALARTMLLGVRLGGTPHLPTPFRWGYGWPQDRGYQALTPEERAKADRLARAQDALAACPGARAESGFSHEERAPDFRVRIPGLPAIALAPHPLREAKPHLRHMGSADPYVVSIGVPTADPGMEPVDCAASGARWLAQTYRLADTATHRARLDETTYLVVYGVPLAGAVQLNAYLFSAAGGTHCVQVHVSRMSRDPGDIEPFIATFDGATIAPR